MKDWLAWFWDEFGPPLVVVAVIAAIAGVLIWAIYGITQQNKPTNRQQYTVEITPELFIRIECSGDCDLAAMIAEAWEAAGK